VKWYRLAAEQGNAAAQNNLGLCYHKGLGVTQDPAEAVKWLRKAAEQGAPGAQHNLGAAYANGEGVKEDLVEAYKWFSLASAQGDENAKAAKSAVVRRMTPQQIAESFRLGLQAEHALAIGGTGSNALKPSQSSLPPRVSCRAQLVIASVPASGLTT
jgi:TPR repeat protein